MELFFFYLLGRYYFGVVDLKSRVFLFVIGRIGAQLTFL